MFMFPAKLDHTNPTVSVVIGAHNAAPWIGETLESVYAQTYEDFEVIVVDDGSTDETRQKVQGFDSTIRYVWQSNAGSAAARNEGVRQARGKYLAFLDADDLWSPDKLNVQVALHESDPIAPWSYTDVLLFESDTRETIYTSGQVYKLYDGWVLRPLLLGNFIMLPSVMVARHVVDEMGGFREGTEARISEDWDLWLRIAPHYPVRCIRQPLTLVRQHASRKTETMDLSAAFKARLGHIERAVARHPEKLTELRDEAVAYLLLNLARKRINREERREARQLLQKALRLHPPLIHAWLYLFASFIPRPFLRGLSVIRRLLRSYT